MVSTRNKRQQKRRLLCKQDDFDQNFIIGNAISSGQKNAVIDNGPVDREFIVIFSDGISTTSRNLVNFQTLERCFNGLIDREMGNI